MIEVTTVSFGPDIEIRLVWSKTTVKNYNAWEIDKSDPEILKVASDLCHRVKCTGNNVRLSKAIEVPTESAPSF